MLDVYIHYSTLSSSLDVDVELLLVDMPDPVAEGIRADFCAELVGGILQREVVAQICLTDDTAQLGQSPSDRERHMHL